MGSEAGVKFVEFPGYIKLVLKTDQEPAITEVQREISDRRRQSGSRGTALENSKVGDNSSSGRTERAVQELGGMVRTLRFALERKTGGARIKLNHPVVPWMIKHAAAQITRFQVRACGTTSYLRLKGHNWSEPMAEFGGSKRNRKITHKL